MSTLSALQSVLAATATAAPPQQEQVNQGAAGLLRLVGRMSFGFTDQEWTLARSLGAQNYIWHHLNYKSIDDSAVEQVLAGPGYETLRYSTGELWALYYSSNFDPGVIISQLIKATTFRAVSSKRQLFERMVEFWNDHFNIYLYADACFLLKTHDDANVARRHALGKFRDLLGASAKSPAMLTYLNNNTNIKAHPNENYARELMELHTLGVDGGYTQRDVQEVARCFTGWTTFPAGTPVNSFAYRFDPGAHDYSAKTLFKDTPHEVTIPQGAESQGNKVLDVLAAHPSTARFISRKLLNRFWGENPPASLVDAIAGVFTASGGDLTSVMANVLWMNVALSTPRKFKRPFHLLTSALRALDSGTDAWDYMANLTYGAGHYPFLWPAPNGYPDAAGYWSGLQLPRWNIGAYMLDGRIPSTIIDARKVMHGAVGSEAVLDRIEDRMHGQPMPGSERAVLRSFLGTSGATPPLARLQEVLSLAIAAPSFQWY